MNLQTKKKSIAFSVAGFVSIGKILASYGANISAIDRKGQTPLHRAVANGNTEFVEWLFSSNLMSENGISVDVLDKELKSPLHLACIKGLNLYTI